MDSSFLLEHTEHKNNTITITPPKKTKVKKKKNHLSVSILNKHAVVTTLKSNSLASINGLEIKFKLNMTKMCALNKIIKKPKVFKT
jgi:hypothetical protein